jgi:cytochrome b6-f complex iron-sulfur subunit
MADEKKRPSVAEILAMARAQASGESAPPQPTQETSGEKAETPAKPATASPAAASPPASAPKVSTSSAGRPSVAEMLAMARAQKGGGAAAPVAPASAAAPKPAPKPAAEKVVTKSAAEKPAPKTGPATRDTSSILAAARTGAKPGPLPKAQAPVAVKERPTAPAKAKVAVPPMPAKPVYAQPKPAKAPATEERRGFMQIVLGSAFAIGNTALALTTGLFTLGTARFMFPNILTEPPSRFKVGFKENFAPGQVETKFVAQYGVWVVNGEYQGQRQIYALRTVCTHLGCTPNWLEGEQKFKCPCHGSGFYKDGINFEGPAPRPLERYAISVGDDGQLQIDKSKMFQEELGQWNDTASFVTA